MANKKPAPTATDYIVPLNMNGLEGRMLRLPPRYKTRQREILLLYGHHALIERWWGLIQNFNDYGAVTMPDLPGFGGMDSFRKVGIAPTIDAYADYLAAFVNMRYRRRRFTIVGVSYGFVIATRMLQKYPELAKKVDMMVSEVGFVHEDDFRFSASKRQALSRVARLLSLRPVAFVFRHACLNAFVIEHVYKRLPATKRRFIDAEPAEFRTLIQFEVKLWQVNDVHTHWRTTSEFLLLDNTNASIDLPIWHICSKGDQFFDNTVVEQHMRMVFSEYNRLEVAIKAHTPNILAGKDGMKILLPRRLRQELMKRRP